jgi:3D (Asp-Asp-Asp) domain-containing protein
MTRFILSWMMMMVVVVAGSATARALGNSKRPSAPAPTLLSPSTPAPDATSKTSTSSSHLSAHALAHAAKTKTVAVASALRKRAAKAVSAAQDIAEAGGKALGNHLARVTAYWSGEGDYYTRHHIASTGIHLHQGHCAVDPRIIPYGSVVNIQGLGSYLAVDTGTAVVSRRAARESGHTRAQRAALVIDLYFESRRAGEQFAANGPKFASITWSKPGPVATNDPVSNPGSLVASGDEPPRSKDL